MAGASVTIPFKRDVMPLLDEVAPTAAAAGAVNTIAIRRRTLDRHEHRRGRLPRAAAPAAAGSRRRARGDSRARAAPRAASGWRFGVKGRRSRSRRGGRTRRSSSRTPSAPTSRPGRRRRDPGTCSSTRRRSGSGARRGETPFAGPFDGRLVYDLIYDPDPTNLMRAAAAAGLPGDRRPGDARRAGRTSVRDLDRPAATRRPVSGSAAMRDSDQRSPRSVARADRLA